MPSIPFLGNIVNGLAVLVGSLIGVALKRGVSDRMQQAIMQALGLCVMFVGLSGTLQNMFTITIGASGGLELATQGTMMMIVSLVVGTFAGQLIDIELRLEQLGDWLRAKFASKGGSNARFTEGFVTSSLIICVGAMAVVGGITDGMGQPDTLFAKSALDFTLVIILSSTMGIGVAFSAAAVFLYQLVFNLIGFFAGNVMTAAMISNLNLVGSVLILGIGFNLLMSKVLVGEHKVKVGNMLPSLIVAVVWGLF